MKKIISIFASLFVLTSLFGCVKRTLHQTTTEKKQATTAKVVTTKEQKTTEKVTTTEAKKSVSVTDILAYKNNEAVFVKGTIYGISNHGFFISDGTNQVYVNLGQDNTPTGVKLGDTVEVEGKFSYTNNFPYVKTVTSYTKVAEGTQITATEVEISSTKYYDASSRTGVYGKYIKVIGTVAQDESGQYYVSDDDGNKVLIDTQTSNTNVLKDFVSDRVKLSVIVYKYDSAWTFSFVGAAADVEDATRSIEDYKVLAEKDIDQRLVKEIYGVLSLPTHHSTLTFLNYTWSVEANNYISIIDNVATVNYDETDHEITLKCTIQSGEATADISFKITSKGIVEQTVKELLSNPPAVNMSAIKVTGIISGIIHNQSRSLYSLVIQDAVEPVNYSVCVEFGNDTAAIANYKVGEKITVEGYYRNLLSNDRPCVKVASTADAKGIDTTKITKAEGTFTVDYTPALVVETEEDYNELAANFLTKYIGRIVKFVNPYGGMNKQNVSTSTYIDLGHSESVKSYVFNGTDTLTFGFVLMGSSDENYGSAAWYTSFGVDSTVKQIPASFTAFVAYYEKGGHAQTMLVNADSVQATDVELDAYMYLTNTIESSSTKFELPAKFRGYDLTWTSKSTDVDNDGTIKKEYEINTKVDFEVSFKVGEETKTVSLSLVALPSEIHTYTVSELANEEESALTYRLVATVVGFASQHGGSYNGNGILVSDGKKVLLISSKGCLTQTDKTNIEGRNKYVYTVGEESRTLAVGDVIQFTNVSVLKKGESIGLATDSVLTFKEKEELTFAPADADVIVIDSKEDLAAYMLAITTFGSNPFADTDTTYTKTKIVKLVGTKENPLYIGNVSGYVNAFYFLGESDTTVAAMSYPVTATTSKSPYFTVVPTLLADTFGAEWLKNNTPTYIDYTTTYGAKNTKTTDATLRYYGFTGEIYLMVEYSGSSSYPYCYMNPIGVGSTLKLIYTEDFANAKIDAGLTTKLITSDSLNDWTLFTQEEDMFDEISYASSNETVLNLTTLTKVHGTEEVKVNVTVTYKLKGETEAKEHVVEVTLAAAGTVEYQLVPTTGSIAVGDKIVIVAKSGDKYYAVAASDFKASVEVTLDKKGNLVLADTVGVFNIVAGAAEDNFAISNGTQVLVATKNSNTSLGYQNSATANASFKLVTEGEATGLCAQGTNSYKYIGFDESTSTFFRADAFDGIMIFKYVFVPTE